MKVKKIFLKDFKPFSTPSLRDSFRSLSFYDFEKFLFNNCSKILNRFSRYLERNFWRTDPGTPYNVAMPLSKTVKSVHSRKYYSKDLFFNTSCFRDIGGKQFIVLVLKIYNYVTFDLNHCISRFRLSRATFFI